jgi:hypothetical protein
MKKVFLVVSFLAACTIILATPAPVRADAFVERTFNGGFEADPMGFGWQTSVSGSASRDLIGSWGAEKVHSGTRSARMSAYGYSTSQIRQPLEVKGKTYRIDFSFWYKVIGVDAVSGSSIEASIKSMTEAYEPAKTGCDLVLDHITTPGEKDLRGDWRQASCLFERFNGEEIMPDSYIVSLSLKSWGDRVFVVFDDVSVISRTYDRIPPTLDITSPEWGSTVQTSTVTINGKASDSETGLKSVEIERNGAWSPVAVDANGQFSVQTTLTAGKNIIPIRALDNGQNYTWRYYELTYHAGTVLGAETAQPTVTHLKTASGKVVIGQGTHKKTFQPFSGYTKGLWGRRVQTANGKIFYVVATTDAGARGGMKVLNAAGKTVQNIKPFGSFKPGYNVTMMVDESSNRIFLAVAPKQYGTVVTIDEFRDGELHFVTTLQATTLAGNLRAKFLASGTDPLRLITVVDGRIKTIKAWKYAASKNVFSRDRSFDTNLVRVTSSSISLKN